jgi:hypothetical protein
MFFYGNQVQYGSICYGMGNGMGNGIELMLC